MERQQAEDIIACLPTGRTIFHYFRDRYALDMLCWFVGSGKPIHEVKRSTFARLLNRPCIRESCSQLGGGVLCASDLASRWPTRPEAYLLTLGLWGSEGRRQSWDRWYYQMSRPGHNLVLQLNFSVKHDRPYEKLIQPGEEHPFNLDCHPINTRGRHTLAWARLDIDLDGGEALIEEVQNDWIRTVLDTRKAAETPVPERWRRYQRHWDPVKLDRYIERALAPHLGIWDEAMLFAAIWFLRSELGIGRVFYHTFTSGNRLKQLTGVLPPRSLYTALPRKFCFRETDHAPAFLSRVLTRKRAGARRKPTLARFQLLEV